VVEHTHKLADHMHTCGLCSPIKACDKHLFLVDELHAAQGVYQDTLNRWMAKKETVETVGECATCPD
jgi:hypothetical protein